MTVRVVHVHPTAVGSSEATIVLEDGEHSCAAFEHPRAARVGDIANHPLLAFETEGIEIDNTGPPSLASNGSPLGCTIRGAVRSREGRLVCVGEFTIELDLPLPGDVSVGDMVRFQCSRLDYMG